MIKTRNRLTLLSLIFGMTCLDGLADTLTREKAIPLAKIALQKQVGIAVDDIDLAYSTAAEWPDSSLGCPVKGMVYQKVLTSGFIVSLQSGERTYKVHVAGTNSVICNKTGSTGQEIHEDRQTRGLTSITNARAHLAAKLNVPINQIEIAAVTRSVWPDTSLGCPQSGEKILQVESTGLKIEFIRDANVYHYHTSPENFRLCKTTIRETENK